MIRSDRGSMRRVTRRDFLNGAALTIAAGLTPAMQLAQRRRILSSGA